MINDEALVDALDDFRANVHPEVITWCENMAVAARKQAPAEVAAGFEALLALAKAAQGADGRRRT